MRHQISWPKDMTQQAADEGKALTAYGYNGPGGRNEFYGPCDDMQATLIVMMASQLHQGRTLDEAVANVKQRVAEFEERKAAREAAKAGA